MTKLRSSNSLTREERIDVGIDGRRSVGVRGVSEEWKGRGRERDMRKKWELLRSRRGMP